MKPVNFLIFCSSLFIAILPAFIVTKRSVISVNEMKVVDARLDIYGKR